MFKSTLKTIKKFLIWLNTPRSIDIPVLGESEDYKLYDELYKQKELLERRKLRLLERSEDYFLSTFYQKYGYVPSTEVIKLNAMNIFLEAKESGNITELYEVIKRKVS